MNSEIKIRPILLTDVEPLSTLAKHTYAVAFGVSLSPPDLEAILNKKLSQNAFQQALEQDVILGAFAGEHLMGYIQFGDTVGAIGREREQELRRLYVHPECQNQGVGARLMQTALQHPQMTNAQSIWLDVWDQNPGAQRFYARFGFVVVGEKRFEVESGAETSSDLIMVRPAGELGISE